MESVLFLHYRIEVKEMTTNKRVTIAEHFSQLTDPRMSNKAAHRLQDIITLTICAVISRTDNWMDVERFGRCKEPRLKIFLESPKEIPLHDTLGRVLAIISVVEFENCFRSWVRALQNRWKDWRRSTAKLCVDTFPELSFITVKESRLTIQWKKQIEPLK